MGRAWRTVTCNKCSKPGHFAKKYRTNLPNLISDWKGKSLAYDTIRKREGMLLIASYASYRAPFQSIWQSLKWQTSVRRRRMTPGSPNYYPFCNELSAIGFCWGEPYGGPEIFESKNNTAISRRAPQRSSVWWP